MSALPSAEVIRTGVRLLNGLIQGAFSVFVLTLFLIFVGYTARTSMSLFVNGKQGRGTVFLPTAPGMTPGFVIEADPESPEGFDETVEGALTP